MIYQQPELQQAFEEGANAPAGAPCPYPSDSLRAGIWQRGAEYSAVRQIPREQPFAPGVIEAYRAAEISYFALTLLGTVGLICLMLVLGFVAGYINPLEMFR